MNSTITMLEDISDYTSFLIIGTLVTLGVTGLLNICAICDRIDVKKDAESSKDFLSFLDEYNWEGLPPCLGGSASESALKQKI